MLAACTSLPVTEAATALVAALVAVSGTIVAKHRPAGARTRATDRGPAGAAADDDLEYEGAQLTLANERQEWDELVRDDLGELGELGDFDWPERPLAGYEDPAVAPRLPVRRRIGAAVNALRGR